MISPKPWFIYPETKQEWDSITSEHDHHNVGVYDANGEEVLGVSEWITLSFENAQYLVNSVNKNTDDL